MIVPLLTNLYLDRIKLNPTWHVDSFSATVEFESNHECTRMKAYRVLDRAFKLLCVVGIDPNDETWVIAYAVVEMENKTAWICRTSVKAKAYYNYVVNDSHHVDEENSNEGASIHFKREKSEDYVDAYYSKARYLEAYSHLIMPMHGTSMWEDTENQPILPPLYTRQPRRLRKKRNKEAGELEKDGDQTPTNPPNNPEGPPKPFKLGRKWQGALKCTICKQE
ncbi:uncharacterized protein [Pyrus communis]|uniref:uncharacterized protein n=1 Tax=Pyrus communis TaxID=23211 RepID=UPI0035C12F81